MKDTKCQKDPLKVIGRAKGYTREELIKNLRRHTLFTQKLIQQIKEIPDVVLRNIGTPQAKSLNKMMREVFTETYRAKQFTRTEINNKGVLYGVVLLKHRVIDLVLKYFHERWPECIVCLYNEYTQKTGVISEKGRIIEIDAPLKQVVEIVSRERKFVPYFSDIQFSGEQIFETLYNSQSITKRENIRYFKKWIPNTCFQLPGMRGGVEKRFKNKKLIDFL
jgi:hypothetical protein